MKKLTKLLLILALFISTITTAQIGFGTPTPHASSAVDISSTTKGFLMPRMTIAQRDLIPSPAAGLMVYVTDTNKPNYFNGLSWIEVSGAVVGGATVSGPPSGLVATPGDGQASLVFSAPANNGGAPITNYIVTSNPAGGSGQGATSPITVTGLTNGTSYTFTLVAVNAVGNSVVSAPSSAVTPIGAPGAPTNAVASYTQGATSASVSFDAPTNNGGAAITGYTVTSNPGGLTATGTSSPLVVTGLSMNQAYTFTVVANNGSASAPSIASNSITTAPLVPSVPLNLVASSTASGSASIAFDVPASDGGAAITNYVVTSIPAGGIGSGSTSPIAVSGLTDGIEYTFTLVATNSAGNSPASASSNEVIPVGASQPPTNVIVAYTQGETSASVSFDAPTNNGGAAISGYTVTSNPGGLTATGTSSPLVVTGLSYGTTYTFTVVANNGSASAPSTASNSINVAASVPDAPTSPIATSLTSTSSSVAFTAPVNNGGRAITGYTVTSSPGGITATGASSPITVTGLTAGTTYTFTVVATNAIGNSEASIATTAVEAIIPPSGLEHIPGTNQVELNWVAPTSTVTGYTVEYKLHNAATWTSTSATTTTATITGLINNSTYEFRVKAVNGVHISDPSTRVFSTPASILLFSENFNQDYTTAKWQEQDSYSALGATPAGGIISRDAASGRLFINPQGTDGTNNRSFIKTLDTFDRATDNIVIQYDIAYTAYAAFMNNRQGYGAIQTGIGTLPRFSVGQANTGPTPNRINGQVVNFTPGTNFDHILNFVANETVHMRIVLNKTGGVNVFGNGNLLFAVGPTEFPNTINNYSFFFTAANQGGQPSYYIDNVYIHKY